LARGIKDGTVRVDDLRTGAELWSLQPYKSAVQGLRFDAVTGWLAVGFQNGHFQLLDAATGKSLHSAVIPPGDAAWVYGAAVSPDRTTVAAAYQFVVGLWDFPTVRWIGELNGHTSWTTSVAFSPDGTRLVLADYDSTARMWDVAERRELLTLRGHTEPLFGVEFSPDGQRLLTSAADGTARIWDGTVPDRTAFANAQRDVIANRLQWVEAGLVDDAPPAELLQLRIRAAAIGATRTGQR